MKSNNTSNANLFRIIGLVIAALWLVLLTYTLPVDTPVVAPGTAPEALGFSWHQFLIDSQNPMKPNIQVLMWISFFFCMAELMNKWFTIQKERSLINQFSLYNNPNFVTIPTDTQSLQIHLDPNEALKPGLLAAIYYAKQEGLTEGSLIAEMFKKINFQFHSTNNVGDVYTAVNSMIELKLHEVDLRYTMVRYLAWLIPTLGFIGTVIGIAVALGKAGLLKSDDPNLLMIVIPLLATAFYTTLLALLLSAVVMIMLQVIQAQDEMLVNDVGSFCLDNIVTNLKPDANHS